MAVVQSSLRISVIDAASRRLRAISGALGRFRSQNRNAMMPLGGAIGRLAAFGGAYIGVTQGISGTVGAARTMQAALTEIGIKADLTKGQLAQLRGQMRSLSGNTNQTTTDLLGGVDAMVTLGLDADRAAAAMPAIGKAATATMSSVTDLSAASVAAMQNMQVMPSEIGKMLDAMTEAGNQGAFEVRDMAREFPALTASAKSLGIQGVQGVTDMAAALQIARRGAGDAGTAANNMANFLQKIMAPQTIKNFKKFGVDVTKELQKANKKGISPIEHFIKLVDEKTEGGRADLLGQLFGDKQVLEFVRPMIADFKDYLKIRGDAERASGTVARAYEQRMHDANQQVKSFRIQMENLGEALGETALKPLGDFAGNLAQVLKTLDKRVGVFDRIKTAIDGLSAGLGFKSPGGMKDWLDAIFGKEFSGSSRDADQRVTQLAKLSNRFREIGRNIRSFAEDVAGNPIARFIADLAGHGFKLMIASAGIGLLAGALWKLGKAAAFLSGLTTAVSIIKGLAKVGGVLFGAGTAGKVASKAVTVGKVAATAGAAGTIGAGATLTPAIAAALTAAGVAAGTGYLVKRFGDDNAAENRRMATHRDAERTSMQKLREHPNDVEYELEKRKTPPTKGLLGWLADWKSSLMENHPDLFKVKTGREGDASAPSGPSNVNIVGIPQIAIPGPVTTQPSGTQDVRVTNPMPAPIVNITVNAKTDADPGQIATAVGNEFSKMLNGLSRSAYSDGAN